MHHIYNQNTAPNYPLEFAARCGHTACTCLKLALVVGDYRWVFITHNF